MLTMSIRLENDTHSEVASFLSQKIVEFNQQHWQGTIKQPLSATYRDDDGAIIAGASGVTFGHWFHLERLWVSETLREKGIGKQLLFTMEEEAIKRGCTFAFVDTLEFQAKPFYQKYGYTVVFEQENYPINGSRYYLIKHL